MTFLEGRCFGYLTWKGTSLQCHNKAALLHPTDTCKKSSGRGYVQVEMDPNLVEFQCFVTVHVASGVCPWIATGLDSCARPSYRVHVPHVAVEMGEVHGVSPLYCSGEW